VRPPSPTPQPSPPLAPQPEGGGTAAALDPWDRPAGSGPRLGQRRGSLGGCSPGPGELEPLARARRACGAARVPLSSRPPRRAGGRPLTILQMEAMFRTVISLKVAAIPHRHLYKGKTAPAMVERSRRGRPGGRRRGGLGPAFSLVARGRPGRAAAAGRRGRGGREARGGRGVAEQGSLGRGRGRAGGGAVARGVRRPLSPVPPGVARPRPCPARPALPAPRRSLPRSADYAAVTQPIPRPCRWGTDHRAGRRGPAGTRALLLLACSRPVPNRLPGFLLGRVEKVKGMG
jgi:hypothetical protein